MKSLFPVFIVENLVEARAFYVEHLSFKVVFEADWYIQLHLEREQGAPLELAFMSPNLSEQHPMVRAGFSGDGVILTLDFEDVDKIYRKLSATDALTDLIIDLKDEPWGQRHFLFRDPAGILVDVVQAISPSHEYEPGYLIQEQ